MEDTHSTEINSTILWNSNKKTTNPVLNKLISNQNHKVSFSSNASFMNLTNTSIEESSQVDFHDLKGEDSQKNLYESLILKGQWSKEDESLLISLKSQSKKLSWTQISSYFKDKNPNQCMYKYKKLVSSSDLLANSIQINNKKSIDSVENKEIHKVQSINQIVSYNQNNCKVNSQNQSQSQIDFLKKYFPNKLINDLQEKLQPSHQTQTQTQTQSERINKIKSSFSPMEDLVLINLYINSCKISESDINLIKNKDKEEVKRRLKLLLKLKGEGFNLTSSNNIKLFNSFIDNLNCFQRIDLTISHSNSFSDGLTYKSDSLICRKRSLFEFGYGYDNEYSQCNDNIGNIHNDNIDCIDKPSNSQKYQYNEYNQYNIYGNAFTREMFNNDLNTIATNDSDFSIGTVERINHKLNLNLNEDDDYLFFNKEEFSIKDFQIM